MGQKAGLELIAGNHLLSIRTVGHPKTSCTANPVINAIIHGNIYDAF